MSEKQQNFVWALSIAQLCLLLPETSAHTGKAGFILAQYSPSIQSLRDIFVASEVITLNKTASESISVSGEITGFCFMF